MRKEISKRLLSLVTTGLVASVLVVGFQSAAFAQQRGNKDEGKAPAPTIDAVTGKVLNEAIELMNMENYAGALAKINTLKLDRLSPYERSKVEQILFNISYTQEKYADARQHLQNAIDAGGLNEQEVSQARYQFAQLYMTEEKWTDSTSIVVLFSVLLASMFAGTITSGISQPLDILSKIVFDFIAVLALVFLYQKYQSQSEKDIPKKKNRIKI